MFTTTLSQPDLNSDDLGRRWRDLAVVANSSFFQDWTWVGCLARERYTNPVLAETWSDGRLVALALFNRGRDRPWGETFYLHETGDPHWDAVFIEHNGPLIAAPSAAEREAIGAHVMQTILTTSVDATRMRRVVMSGITGETYTAVCRVAGHRRTIAVRSAPYVDLGGLPADQPYLNSLRRNTRHQVRRSDRRYAERGPLSLRRAETVSEGHSYFERLLRLHATTWASRGQSGAFAMPTVRRFHEALLAEGIPRQEIDLLEIMAGSEAVGYLMNFNHRGVVSAYQSGFHYPNDDPHLKPGLTSHCLAIDAALRGGNREYDFLAGSSRYKTSLSNAERSLFWLELSVAIHPAALRARLRGVLERWRGLKANLNHSALKLCTARQSTGEL